MRNSKGQYQLSHSGGRSKGARNKLTSDFLTDLHAAWQEEGKAALKIMIREEPSQFVRTVASLMPREVKFEVENQFGDMTDEEVREVLEYVRVLRAKLIEPKEPALIEAEEKADASA
jgi:hypothetical protein